jgi:3D domain
VYATLSARRTSGNRRRSHLDRCALKASLVALTVGYLGFRQNADIDRYRSEFNSHRHRYVLNVPSTSACKSYSSLAVAQDIGGRIKGAHIDRYTGAGPVAGRRPNLLTILD